MSRDLFTKFDFTPVDETLATIRTAMYSRYGFGPYRQELELRAEALQALVESFEQNGQAETDEAVYLALFDGLSHLRYALKGLGVKANALSLCRTSLENAKVEAAMGGEA